MVMYSHSRLSTFEQCPLRYKYRYIDKLKPLIEKSIEAHLGTAVHDTLEWLYNSVKENPEIIPTIEQIITCYADKWQESYSDDILIVKKELTSKDYFNKGVEFLMNYYTKHKPFKDGTIECEKRIIIELKDGSKLQGYIDRLVHNQETKEYEVHDYKTANTLPTQAKMDEDRQLALYSIAIKEIYGKDKNICLVWHYLAHNQKICSRRTDEQLEDLKNEIIELIKKIEATENFPPKESVLCGWCEFKDACPKFGGDPSILIRDKEQTSIEKFDPVEKQENKFKNTLNEEGLDIW
jgi:putative RecB family exonuclease